MKPIIFSTDMVKAILEGRKTQTRRIIKGQASLNFFSGRADDTDGDSTDLGIEWRDDTLWFWNIEYPEEGGLSIKCPYGQVGDKLWVRENWWVHLRYDHLKPRELPDLQHLQNGIEYMADQDKPTWAGRTRVARFLPKRFSRITLEITGIRVERLQEITEDDAKAEGAPSIMLRGKDEQPFDSVIPSIWYEDKWDSLNAKRGYGWDTNPWVWVIEFKVCEP